MTGIRPRFETPESYFSAAVTRKILEGGPVLLSYPRPAPSSPGGFDTEHCGTKRRYRTTVSHHLRGYTPLVPPKSRQNPRFNSPSRQTAPAF